MDKKKSNILFLGIVAIAFIILVSVGATFAYFNATMSSEEDAVSLGAAEFSIELEEDTDLIKSNIIPSIEEYVDIAAKRVDPQTKKHIKPYEDEQGKYIIEDTACIDDNLNEICSIYTFTVKNPMPNTDVPLYFTLNQSINTFENLYFKVLDSNMNEVISATRLLDNRYEVDPKTGGYLKDENNELVQKSNFNELELEPIVLEGINKQLDKAKDENTPSEVTYSIVMWIMENNQNQTKTDSGKLFASTLHVTASGANGGGITGVFSSTGTE